MTFLPTSLGLQDSLNRRLFLRNASSGLGAAALANLLTEQSCGETKDDAKAHAALSGFPNFAPKAKRIIYLFQSGAPSQMDLFDPKPELEKRRGEDLPESIRKGQRLTTMTSGQGKFPVAPTIFKFALPVLSELEDRRSDRELRLPRRHRRQPLPFANRLRQVFPAPLL